MALLSAHVQHAAQRPNSTQTVAFLRASKVSIERLGTISHNGLDGRIIAHQLARRGAMLITIYKQHKKLKSLYFDRHDEAHARASNRYGGHTQHSLEKHTLYCRCEWLVLISRDGLFLAAARGTAADVADGAF